MPCFIIFAKITHTMQTPIVSSGSAFLSCVRRNQPGMAGLPRTKLIERMLQNLRLLDPGVFREFSSLIQSSPGGIQVIDQKLQHYNALIAIYKIPIGDIGDVLLAVARDSVDYPHNLITPDWSNARTPKKLPPFLNQNASYGGTRLAKPKEGIEKAIESLLVLAYNESGTKHTILNSVISQDTLKDIIDKDEKTKVDLFPPTGSSMPAIQKGYEVPSSFFNLKFRGGRCVILPKDETVYQSLLGRDHGIYHKVFEPVGAFLNGFIEADEINYHGLTIGRNSILPGSLFLTPDYGSNAEVADILYEYTPHVLGVTPNRGGGGGKSSYTTSYMKGFFESYLKNNSYFNNTDTPVVLVGSAGAIGSDFAKYIEARGYKNVTVCDLNYDLANVVTNADRKTIQLKSGGTVDIPASWTVVDAEQGRFTDRALSGDRPKLFIMTSVGHELQKSNFNLIPDGSMLFLAHNFSLPDDPGEQDALSGSLSRKKVDFISGPALTPGGALYSRLEIAHRAQQGISFDGTSTTRFPKMLMHAVAKSIGEKVADEIHKAKSGNPSIFLANNRFAVTLA